MSMSSGEESVDINVTPLIDVLLCLLIIFMIATPPPPEEKQPIKLPEEVKVEVPSDPKATLLVSIDEKGKAKLGNADLPDDHEGRVAALKASEKAQADGKIAIEASGKVAYGKVIAIMAAAREAGIGNVGLASDRL